MHVYIIYSSYRIHGMCTQNLYAPTVNIYICICMEMSIVYVCVLVIICMYIYIYKFTGISAWICMPKFLADDAGEIYLPWESKTYEIAGILVKTRCLYWHICLPTVTSCQPAQGKQGCRNIRGGGDNVKPAMDSDDVFMCYIVYRSFKNKPT